jgi:hypothetical protein
VEEEKEETPDLELNGVDSQAESQAESQAASADQCPPPPQVDSAQCGSEVDTCWNTGKRDDCQRGHFCCFDGCVKTCFNLATQQFLRHPESQLGGGDDGRRGVCLLRLHLLVPFPLNHFYYIKVIISYINVVTYIIVNCTQWT